MLLTTGPENNRKSLFRPSWAEVVSAVQAMDGQNVTNLMLGVPQDGIPVAMPYLAIGGGAGSFVVYITFDDTRFYRLMNIERRQGMGNLVAGGQMIEVHLQEIVDEATALKAVQTFFENLALNSDLDWDG